MAGPGSLQALHVVQFLVVPIQGDKFLMGAAFHDFTFVEHTDFIGVLDGAEAVGDGNGRA